MELKPTTREERERWKGYSHWFARDREALDAIARLIADVDRLLEELKQLRADYKAENQMHTETITECEEAKAERDEWKRSSRRFEEVIDQIREVLGLEETHYLIIADQVEDVVKERDHLRGLLDANHPEPRAQSEPK